MTFGVIVGNRGFFPGHLAQSGRAEMIAVLEKAGYQAVVPGPDETKFGAVETRAEAARCAELFQETPRRHRRHHRHAAQFRRRARHRRYPAHGRSERPGAGAGHPRYARPHDHRGPPRQLLRQDVGLQQPDAVRHSLLAHHAAHRGARIPTVFRQDLAWFAAVCRVVRGLRQLAHRRHRRAARGLQHRALQREDPGSQRHLRRAHRPFRNPRPHRAHERPGRRGRQAKLAAIQRYVSDRRRARRSRS